MATLLNFHELEPDLNPSPSVSSSVTASDGTHSMLRPMLKSLGWLGTQKVLVILLGVAATGTVARHLGPEKSGVLSAAQALAALFGIASMGVDATIFTAHLHRHPERESAIMGGTTIVLAASGLLSWLVLALYLWLFETHSLLLSITTAVIGLRMLMTFPAPLAMWFQSRLLTREIVIANTSGAIVLRAWQFLSSSAGWGVVKVAVGEVLSLIVIGCISLRTYLLLGGHPLAWKADWKTGAQMLLCSLPGLIATALATFLSRLDVIMLRAFSGETEVGYFTAASSITESLLFVGGMLTMVFSPVLIKTFHSSRKDYEQQRVAHLRLCSLLGWCLALSLCAGSSLVIPIVFGAAYQPSGFILAMHAFLLIPAMLGSAVQCHLTIEGRLRWLTLILIVALGVTAVLNLIFIPLWGGRGAAAATVLAAVLAYTLVPALFPNTRRLARDTLCAFFFPMPHKGNLQAFCENKPEP